MLKNLAAGSEPAARFLCQGKAHYLLHLAADSRLPLFPPLRYNKLVRYLLNISGQSSGRFQCVR